MISTPPESILRKKVWLLAGLVVGMIFLAILWRGGLFGDGLSIEVLAARMRQYGATTNPVFAVLMVVGASIVAVPLAVIIIATGIAFGPWWGVGFVMLGATIGGCLSYSIGRGLGHQALCRLAGDRVNRLSAALGAHGLISVIVIRMLPIAPFAIANMVAGATHIRFRDFVMGTLIGMLPGVLVMTFFVDQIVAAISGEDGGRLLLLGGILVFVAIGLLIGRRFFNRKSAITEGERD